MSSSNPLETKQKVFSFLERNGPSLPIHVGREINMNTLFSSAFLSELISEKRVKVSSMKVGGSPLYFIPGQEPRLERFSSYLSGKEKEAYLLLQDSKFLVDEDLVPPIRVALRAIRDFAFPFKRNDKLIWRYFTVPEEEFNLEIKAPQVIQEKIELVVEKPREEFKEKIVIEETPVYEEKKPEYIQEKEGEGIKPSREKIKKVKKAVPKKSVNNDKFFNQLKEVLSEKSYDISDIVSFSKNDICLLTNKNRKEVLVVAYNKKRLEETDIIKAHKKSLEMEVPYVIVSKGELPKKIKDFLEALKNLQGIEKIE